MFGFFTNSRQFFDKFKVEAKKLSPELFKKKSEVKIEYQLVGDANPSQLKTAKSLERHTP
ncbi:hypothetical protein NIES4074_56410 [Cylindrospermum sp. NIES-4074]|nr:hypothetical protein NIES4074_56410 [Cylindrospermum sp. NIES-4074]